VIVVWFPVDTSCVSDQNTGMMRVRDNIGGCFNAT
jgi:hypothetical protein